MISLIMYGHMLDFCGHVQYMHIPEGYPYNHVVPYDPAPDPPQLLDVGRIGHQRNGYAYSPETVHGKIELHRLFDTRGANPL